MMKILITGANGLLGQHLVELLAGTGFDIVVTGKGNTRLPAASPGNFTYVPADLSSQVQLDSLMENIRPRFIVHAAAMTQVDECEQNHERCFAINVEATASLLMYAERYHAHFIYISTDFVFDGEKGQYAEDDDLNPVSWYGFTKMQAEAMVQTSDIPWTIVRTCLVYGKSLAGTRSTLIHWVKENLFAGKPIQVVSDQVRTPTWAGDLAKSILLIIQKNATGIFHISGKEIMTPYEMACETAAFLQADASLIREASALNFTQPGKRPPVTGFSIHKAVKELGYEPVSFKEGLKRSFQTPEGSLALT